MRTENDLRIALLHQAAQAPEVTPALIARTLAGQDRHAPTRARLSIAVAVAIVAALIAVPLAIRHLTATSTGPAAPRPDQRSALSWVTVSNSDYRIGRTLTAGSNVEILQIQTKDFSEWALADFAPGTFDQSVVADATPITVDGHPGYFAKQTAIDGQHSPYLDDLLSPLVNGSFGNGYGYFSTMAWQLDPDHWVMLDRIQIPTPNRTPSATEQEMLDFAATLHLKVRTQPVRQVFKVGYLPGTGWQLKSLTISDLGAVPLDSDREALLAKGNLTVQISVQHGIPPDQDYPYRHRIVGDYLIEVNRDAERSGHNPLDDVTTQQILDSITLAAHPVTEDSSWFPISTLLP